MLQSFKMILRFVLVILFIGCPLVSADPVLELENKSYWLCKSSQGKEVRTIRVQVSESGICSTFYSKLGAEKVVGSGKNQESCLNFLNNIRTNLEKSNWSCRDISTTRITAGVEQDAE